MITHKKERKQYRKIVTKSKSNYKIHAYAYTSMKSTGHRKRLYLQKFYQNLKQNSMKNQQNRLILMILDE